MMRANLPSLLQSFFTARLLQQRQASPHTIAGYRDCFRLLLHFAKERLGKPPSKIQIEDLDPPFLGRFFEYLERVRKNSARTRNARLAALHSFFKYVAFEEPAYALQCQRILAMPNKRHIRRPIEFLNRQEMDAGRKQRCTPLRPEAKIALRAWLRERGGVPESPAFPSVRRDRLSRDAIERLTTKYVKRAAQACPSLERKRVSPHVLRHYLPSLTMSSDVRGFWRSFSNCGP
jgi:integrase/recombinase XerD